MQHGSVPRAPQFHVHVWWFLLTLILFALAVIAPMMPSSAQSLLASGLQ
jgi:hypothetical protein